MTCDIGLPASEHSCIAFNLRVAKKAHIAS